MIRKADATKPVRLAWSITELAAALGASYWTINRHVHAGELNAIKVGGEYRISVFEVAKFLQVDPINVDNLLAGIVERESSGQTQQGHEAESSHRNNGIRPEGRLRPVMEEHYQIRRAFKVSETAWLLGCSARAVLDMIHDGRLAAIRPSVKGGYYVVPKSEIERLIASAERR